MAHIRTALLSSSPSSTSGDDSADDVDDDVAQYTPAQPTQLDSEEWHQLSLGVEFSLHQASAKLGGQPHSRCQHDFLVGDRVDAFGVGGAAAGVDAVGAGVAA